MSDFIHRYDFEQLENDAVRLVIEELERQLKSRNDVCVTEECILDMAAYALNHVRPMYRATLLGKLYADAIGQEHHDEIERAVGEAIERINAHPPETV